MQRSIWIVTFFIILAGSYYWFVVHETDKSNIESINVRNELQSESINVVSELERRLELRYIGHGKHLQQIQDEYRKHYEDYLAKVDSINMVFEEVKYSIQEMDERLVKKINGVKDDLRELGDRFDSYKRTTNRTIRDIQQDVSTNKDDIKAINETLAESKEKK